MTMHFDTSAVLKNFGVTKATLSQNEKNFLDENGYLPLPGILSPAQVGAMRARLAELLEMEKEKAGLEVHQEAGTARLANLVDKGEVFQVCLTHPRVLAAVAHVLGSIKLSSLNSRAALPGQGLQALHADWHEAVEPNDFKVCNTLWLLDDFTTENGATRLVPKSHRLGKVPSDVMKDPRRPHPEEQLMLGPAGTVVVVNSHTWHGGTLNRTKAPRRCIHSYWCRRDQPQQLDQRCHLNSATKARLSPTVRYLLDVDEPA